MCRGDGRGEVGPWMTQPWGAEGRRPRQPESRVEEQGW